MPSLFTDLMTARSVFGTLNLQRFAVTPTSLDAGERCRAEWDIAIDGEPHSGLELTLSAPGFFTFIAPQDARSFMPAGPGVCELRANIAGFSRSLASIPLQLDTSNLWDFAFGEDQIRSGLRQAYATGLNEYLEERPGLALADRDAPGVELVEDGLLLSPKWRFSGAGPFDSSILVNVESWYDIGSQDGQIVVTPRSLKYEVVISREGPTPEPGIIALWPLLTHVVTSFYTRLAEFASEGGVLFSVQVKTGRLTFTYARSTASARVASHAHSEELARVKL